MSSERISYLLAQLTGGTISSPEKEELNQFALDPRFRDSFTGILQEMMEAGYTEPEWKPLRLDEMVQNILSADKTGKPARSISLFPRKWIAAASIIFVLMAATYYLLVHQQKQPSVANVHDKNDVAPGGNKAILTLAGGSTIILDSAGLGSIAQQGTVNIIKTDSGKLAYNILKRPEALLYNTLTTPRGGQYQLVLPDGTRVWLNAASSIKYPVAFIGKDRTVEITGEAYFEVKHDAKFPFKVKVNDMIIEDIGTEFNVNAYTDEGPARTTLIEGAVSVSKGKETAVLKPGNQSTFNIQHSTFNIQQKVDLEQTVAWKNGLFSFTDADLQSVMRQLARWYNVEVIYAGPVPHREFNGKIGRSLTLSQVLNILTRTRVKYKIEDGSRITIMP